MGYVYLIFLIALSIYCFYVTGAALGEAQTLAAFSTVRFFLQAAIAGIPGIGILLAITTQGAELSLWAILWFSVAATLHIMYCQKFFGTKRGTVVAFASMIAVFLILALVFFIQSKIQQMFYSFYENRSRGKQRHKR